MTSLAGPETASLRAGSEMTRQTGPDMTSSPAVDEAEVVGGGA